MTITAQGPKIAVTLNGEEVSGIDLDQWTEPGKRPDGYEPQVRQGRDPVDEPAGLLRLPGPRPGLLVQEREAQRPEVSEGRPGARDDRGGPSGAAAVVLGSGVTTRRCRGRG